MAGFSSSQISDMISRRKYEVKRGDTLSELAESFMKAFPTLNRFSRSNIEDMIFSENSSNAFKDRNKSLLLEGKYLELKFILEARRREFRFDHSAKEYPFTDEDRLAFAISGERILGSLLPLRSGLRGIFAGILERTRLLLPSSIHEPQ